MASVGHALFGLAVARRHGARHRVLASAVFAGLALLPDADVVGFKLGIPYASAFGHRGASHSIVAAIVLGALATPLVARALGASWRMTLVACVAAVLSHGLFDT